ncbi:unnamed protein product [Oppiella nova]|uniref:Uncharacterized protein n=1 Tax=Oppiella nova TaxID=334625 RepID=A0A7R9M930_9ACAR|nr:unnamed protein product [Oppiella nova]CAG2172507.1 unnamed protein product [Oppiella nova]
MGSNSKTTYSLEFGKLIINDKQSKNDIELKANHKTKDEEVLVTTFLKTDISSVNRIDKSAKIVFSRDPRGEHNYGVVNELANDQKYNC